MSKASQRKLIVQHLENAHEPLTADQLSSMTGIRTEDALTQLNVLRRKGTVVTRRGRRWTLASEPRES